MATSSAVSLAFLTATAAVAAAQAAGIPNDPMKQPPPSRRRMPYVNNADLKQFMGEHYDPETALNWMSISEDVEFLPVMKHNNDKKAGGNDKGGTAAKSRNGKKNVREGHPPSRRHLATSGVRTLEETTGTTSGAYDTYNPYSVEPFVEGMGQYDEYQQAWRLLGFMIDCNNPVEDDDYEASGGSGDEYVTEEGCARYVLWAAYVDLGYEGGGIGEYQYWDRDEEAWNDSACYYADGNAEGGKSRCAKMDCHLESTHFSVLGFFKHRSYDDWMEQLFKHEGMCVWTDEEYAFMKNARKAWPSGCVDTGAYANAENEDVALYYNIRPLQSGRIAIGLYTDAECLTVYPATTEYVEEIVGNVFTDHGGSGSGDNYNYDFSQDTFEESMERWDSAFDVWHLCHPCVAHDLENTGGDKYTYDDDGNYNYGNDDGNGYWWNRRKLGGEYYAKGDVFECYDDAGYTNVNQCMKFSAKTVMKTATFRDLSLGSNQASLVEYPLSGYINSSTEYQLKGMGTFATYFFLAVMSCAFAYSVWNLYKTAKGTRALPTLRDSLL